MKGLQYTLNKTYLNKAYSLNKTFKTTICQTQRHQFFLSHQFGQEIYKKLKDKELF